MTLDTVSPRKWAIAARIDVLGRYTARMATNLKDLIERAKRLPISERAAVVEALLDSMDPTDPSRDENWAQEAALRLAAFESGELSAIDAEEVLSKLRR